MKKNTNPIARTKDLVVQDSNEEILIYDLNEHKAFCMNKTLVAVWKACDGTRSTDEIAAYLREKQQTPINFDLVNLALLQLSENSLLAENESYSFLSVNVSRRKLIRNAALTTTIALPIISHLIAPPAGQAQSCLMTGEIGGVPNACTQPIGFTVCADTICPNPQNSSRCCSGTAQSQSCTPITFRPGTEVCQCICT